MRSYLGGALDIAMDAAKTLMLAEIVDAPAAAMEFAVERVIPGLSDKINDAIIQAASPGSFGLCGGMAFAARDYYLAYRSNGKSDYQLPMVGRQTQQPDRSTPDQAALRDYIWLRLLDSLQANVGRFLEYVVTLKILPDLGGPLSAALGAALGSAVGPVGTVVGGIIGGVTSPISLGGQGKLQDWSREEWAKLKAKLDAGEPWPMGLVGDSLDLFNHSHQVLATGYDDHGRAGPVDIYIYDNNHPYTAATQPVVLTLNFGSSTLEAKTTGGSSEGYMPLQGIICEDYAPKVPPLM
jgi:hypothetical protein